MKTMRAPASPPSAKPKPAGPFTFAAMMIRAQQRFMQAARSQRGPITA